MRKPVECQKRSSTARFKRAVFFVCTIFLPHTHLEAYDQYDRGVFSVSSSKNSTKKITGGARDRMQFLREGHATLGNTSHIRDQACQQNHQIPPSVFPPHHVDPDLCRIRQEAGREPAPFKDFLYDLLKVKVGETALYLVQRFMTGIERGGLDVRVTLMEERRMGRIDFAPGFLQKVKSQSVKQTIGDVVELLSRKIVHASAVIVAITAIAITIEAGAALATGTASAIAAQKLFEPFTFTTNPDGTAAIRAAVSSSTSTWQVIATALSSAVQAFAVLVESIGNLFCAVQDGGGKPTNTTRANDAAVDGAMSAANKKGLDASFLKFSKTVKNHAHDIIKRGRFKGELSRPYLSITGKNTLINEIMTAKEPTLDNVLENGLRWDVPGALRGSPGIWELVVDTSTNTIVHFNFVVP